MSIFKNILLSLVGPLLSFSLVYLYATSWDTFNLLTKLFVATGICISYICFAAFCFIISIEVKNDE